ENAIEHGFNNIDYTGKLDINFSLQHNEIIITVTDNGRGLGPTTNKHENHISRAVQIVEDRLFLLNRARMNPHFFFNTLTALQTMALQKSPDKTLGLNLSKFAAIMRITLESTYHEYVTIYDETAYLTTYLNLQQLRFPNKFDFEIKQEDDLDTEAHLIPSMLIQPFVENAIEHGFNNIDYTGKLDINFSLQHNEIIITVTFY
ncbi:MAG: histidine kinase, partial [Chitinophagaceae bacterium]|nr:histidine kinase [Chitinophagaceae bacterium]